MEDYKSKHTGETIDQRLEPASSSKLGTVIVGSGIDVDEGGVISVRFDGHSVEVVDNLTSVDADKALSASMGKKLKDIIDLIRSVEVEDSLNSSDSDKALSARQGNILLKRINLIIIPEIADDLLTQDSSKTLSARMGYVLNKNINEHNVSDMSHQDIREQIRNIISGFLTPEKVKSGDGIKVLHVGDGTIKISSTIDNDLFVIVERLPEVGLPNKFYIVPNTNASDGNIKEEYFYINGRWEKVGSVTIDIGNYYTKGEANNKINELIAAHNSSEDAHAGIFVNVPPQTITTEMWLPSGSRFKCSVNVDGMKATSVGWWSPAHDSEEECASAGVLSLVQTFQGRYELYAKKKPTKNIIVHVFYKK